jgi:hypothetical protein
LLTCVLKWPDAATVDRAVRFWAEEAGKRRPGLRRLGYFGSYARGDWGVGSDLDLVAIVDQDSDPFERRLLRWDLGALPVPADILVYTEREWQHLETESSRFARMIADVTVWVYASES